MMIFASLILAFILAIVPNLVWLLVFVVGRVLGWHTPYAPFGWTAFGLVALCWTLLAYGFYIGRWRLAVTNLDYRNTDVPQMFDGYRIVHISDLHLSTFDDNHEKLGQIVDRINSLNPDLVCFTGDLVTLGPEEAEPYVGELSRISATDGVVSVLGNHDFLLYSRKYRTDDSKLPAIDSVVNIQRMRFGWNVLRNQSTAIERKGEKITIIGVDNENCSNQGFHTISRGDLTKAAQGTEGFRILLTHDPSHWEHEVLPKTDIQLTLSGHTHAAQVRIFGWTPAKWAFRQTYGRYDSNGQTLYVNIGLGCTAPVRLGANPEITLITLKSAMDN